MRLFTLQRGVVLLFSKMIVLSLCLNFAPRVQAETGDVVAQINEYMDALVKAGKFNGSLLIARDGKVVVSKGYGMSNFELDVPNTPQTKFRIGSITKPFTAMAIMLLQQRGKLTVQESICKYVSECLASWQQITLHHLLSHTSGLAKHDKAADYLKTAMMPMSVMQDIKVDYLLPLREIAPLLNMLSREVAGEEGRYPVPDDVEIESRIAEQKMESGELIASVERLGKISKLTCPDCHGALWELDDEKILRYRCHVGHAFTAESLNEGQSEMLEVALWSAVRALEEQMMLAMRIVERARKAKHERAASMFEKRAREAEKHSTMIREVLLSGEKVV